MKKILLLAGLILMTLLSNNVYSQTKTPYEKKKEALSLQFMRDLGVSPALIKKYSDAGEIGALFFLGNISEKLNTERGLLLMLKYEQDLKKAKSLMNATDFKKEADKLAEKKRKEEEELAKRQAKEQEENLKEQEQERQRQLQKEREEQEYAYNNSDYVAIKKDIKREFDEWLTKGEFEKTEVYNDRIKNKDIVFDSICHSIINSALEEKFHDFRAEIELAQYDADNEKYPIKVTLDGKHFLDTLNIKLNDAQKFKEEMQYYGRVVLPKGEANWCLRENNLFPLKINLKNTNIEIKVPITKKYTLLNFSSNELNLANSVEELKYQFADYESKREKRLAEIKENQYKEVIKKADDNELNKEYLECLKNLKTAKSISNKDELNGRIISIQSKIDFIKSKYAEIEQAKNYISSNYQIQELNSQKNLELLIDKNKKAGTNFQSALQVLKSKYNLNDELLKFDLSNNEKKLVWSTNEDKILSAYTEKVSALRTWLDFNNEVARLLNEKEIKTIKNTENPEELILKLTTKK